MKRLWVSFWVGFALARCTSEPTPAFDMFKATGFFRIDRDAAGRWWLVDPDGKKFFSTGVNVVSPLGDYAPKEDRYPYHEAVLTKYGSEDRWADETAARMRAWGWNTVGAWSDLERMASRMPYTPIVDCSGGDWLTGRLLDYFSAQFRAHADEAAAKATRGRATDRNLIGYFLDNELHWGYDHRNPEALLDQYFQRPATAAGKIALVDYLKSRYTDVTGLQTVWQGPTRAKTWNDVLAWTAVEPLEPIQAERDRSAFLARAAETYFRVCTLAVRARDPNHLLLGSRIVSVLAFPEVITAAGATQDVVSINFYEYVATFAQAGLASGGARVRFDDWLAHVYAVAGKPLLISEFGYRARDAGLPNTWPPIYPVLRSQAERADKMVAYARRSIATGYIVGYHLFQWMDQPASGRFDGENNNWGLVNIDDEPYQTVVDAMRQVNIMAQR